MHILLANRWYPPLSHGGVAMYNYYLAHALIKLGHRVTVVASRTPKVILDRTDDDGVDVYRLPFLHHYRLHRAPIIGRYMRALEQARYSMRVAQHLAFLEIHNSFDLVEFADVNAEGWAYLRRRRRRPAVVRCHTPTFVLRDYARQSEMPYDTALISRMEMSAIRHAEALTAPSRDMAHTIAHHCSIAADSIKPIPNPLDPTRYSLNGRDNSFASTDETIILHVGRLERIKGIGVLAQAIPRVLEDAPAVRFVFIGAARSEQKASAWADRLQTVGGERVSVLGYLEEGEMMSWYQRADIAVVPSLNYESFSYTCAQAMAAGLPVVASRIGGIPETVPDGECGMLIPPGDVDALVEALVKLAQEPELRCAMGVAAAERASRRFSASILAEEFLAIYQRLTR